MIKTDSHSFDLYVEISAKIFRKVAKNIKNSQKLLFLIISFDSYQKYNFTQIDSKGFPFFLHATLVEGNLKRDENKTACPANTLNPRGQS